MRTQIRKDGTKKVDVKNLDVMKVVEVKVEHYTNGNLKESVTRLGHHVYDGKRWVKQKMEPHPLVIGLRVVVDKSGYSGFGLSIPKKVQLVVTNGLADTGAQMTVISSALELNLGVK